MEFACRSGEGEVEIMITTIARTALFTCFHGGVWVNPVPQPLRGDALTSASARSNVGQDTGAIFHEMTSPNA